MAFQAFSFTPWSYQELVRVVPLRVPWLTHETPSSHNVFFRGFHHEVRKLAAALQFRVFFTRVGISHLCCSSLLERIFYVACSFPVFFSLSRIRFSSLPGSSSAADAQPRSIVFFIDPTPCCVLRCIPTSDSFMFPAMGGKKSGLYSPKSTVSPIYGYQHRADGLWTASLLALTLLLADFGMITTPIQTSSVSCYSDSFENLEVVALQKKIEAVETLEQISADTRKDLVAQKALVHRLEIALEKRKQNYDDTLRSLKEKIRQKCLDNRNFADLKETISDLRTQVANLNAHRQALPLLHQLLYQLTVRPQISFTQLLRLTAKLPSLKSKRITIN